MNSYNKLLDFQKEKKSFLCVGLDTDINKLPSIFAQDVYSILKFNSEIINATIDYTSCYKINFAFYEQYGSAGFEIIKQTIELINNRAFIIADSKRGDIGNTSEAYSKSCFEYFGADAITVAPYMGFDSVQPFIKFEDKLTFILALTSNPGSADFQRLMIDGKPLFMHVIEKSITWGNVYNTGFVTGATHPDDIKIIREIIPNYVLLIPGVGTQGGSIEKLISSNNGGPCIINVSRDIIYAGAGADYKECARDKAKFYYNEFNRY
jgi:orotidine-5'-phosphate decarboxylase